MYSSTLRVLLAAGLLSLAPQFAAAQPAPRAAPAERERRPDGEERDRPRQLKPGDKVIFDFGPGLDAEVVTVLANGWYEIKVTLPGGFSTTKKVRPGQLRLPDRTEVVPDREFRPGDRVIVDGLAPVEGVVEGYTGKDRLRVKMKKGAALHTAVVPVAIVRLVEPGPGAASERGLRIWTDVTGKYKTEATFVAVNAGVVTLKKADGSTANVPLEKLDPLDRALAERLAANSLAAPVEIDAAKLLEPVWDGVREVVLDDTVKTAGLVPDAAPPLPKISERPIFIPERKGASGHRVSEGAVRLLFAPAKAEALAAFLLDAGSGTRQRLVRFDLAGSKLLESVDLPADSFPEDVDSSGQVLVGRTEFGSRFHGRVDVFRLESGQARPIASWRPYLQPADGFAERRARIGLDSAEKKYWDVQQAGAIDQDHVYTFPLDRKLTVWKAAEAKALYSVQMAKGACPAISGGGKYLAVTAANGRIYVLDARTGQPLLRLVGPYIGSPRLAFRPDGKQLACTSHGVALVWDVETGKVVFDIAAPFAQNRDELAWPAEGYLLADGSKLIDLNRRIVLWYYRGMHIAGRGVFGGRYWNVEYAPGGQQLASAPLPHPEALTTAAGLDPEKLLAVRPGVEIAVRVAVALPPADQAAIRESLVKRLAENGMKVVPEAKLVLHATTEQGKPEEVEYRTRGNTINPGQKVTVSSQISRLSITENGQPIWSAAAVVGAPLFVEKGGKDLSAAVAERMKPEAEFFLRAGLPTLVARPGPAGGAYGDSVLSDLTVK